jgi:hypothetical protein
MKNKETTKKENEYDVLDSVFFCKPKKESK